MSNPKLSDVLFGSSEDFARWLEQDPAKDPERQPKGEKATSKAKKGKAARALGHSLSNKAAQYYQERGYMAFRVDYTISVHGGALQSMDLLGIGDVLAVGHGRVILVQSTVAEHRTRHERKLCDDTRRLPRVLKTVFELAAEWFDHGGEIEMVCFEKDTRGHWVPQVYPLTREWLMERKAKLDGRRSRAI